MTKRVYAGRVAIGGDAPISVQSMTNTDTRDFEATLAQIRRLHAAGCDIVRMSVYDEACVKNVRPLVEASPVPLVADIHFNHRLAIASVENGISKLRINPGNIGGEANVRALADCLRVHHVPVRIGVNSGSVELDIVKKHGGVTAEGMLESALNHARLLEKYGFDDIVLSMKGSNARMTVACYRMASKLCDYPLHVGVTEAGGGEEAVTKSAIGIGALLLDGIGDTVRVSLTGAPEPEVAVCLRILRALGLRDGVDVISCPTCGRTCIDVAGIAAQVRERTRHLQVPLRVAVMGCVVNGPGEAREADVGIAGGKEGGILFRRGEKPRTVRGDLTEALMREVDAMLKEGSYTDTVSVARGEDA